MYFFSFARGDASSKEKKYVSAQFEKKLIFIFRNKRQKEFKVFHTLQMSLHEEGK